MKGISVIICCHNSIDRLKPTLEHIACQEIASGLNWELMIIDNASVDGSGEFAKVELERLNFSYSYKILTENKPGLIHARKRAIKESNYEYLLFCDDDNWLAADYVRTAFMIMESNLSIGALGGWGEPIYESAPPVWFQKMEIQYATGKQGEISGEVPGQLSYVYGAGAIYRKSVFEKLNFLEVDFYLTGRIGKRLLASEDVEIGYWVALLGYKIWFSDQLKFMHFTETKRLSWKYVLANAYGHGYSRAFLRPYQEILFGQTYALNADLFRLFRDCVSLVKNLPYNIARRHCMINIGQRWGEINAYLQNRKQITAAGLRINNRVALIVSVN